MKKSAKHRNNFNHTAQIGVEQFPIYDSLSARTFLNYLISQIRPHKNHPFAVDNIRLLISHLQSNPTLRSKLQEAVVKAFERVHFSTFFTESGMPICRDFWPELTRRIRHKILPPLTQKDTFSAILNQFFPKKNDYLWVKEVGPELWTELFNTTGWHISPQQLTQLLPAIREAGINLLTPEYIEKLSSEDQKEAAHALNRRTEFKIVKGPTSIIIKSTRLRKVDPTTKAAPNKQSQPAAAPKPAQSSAPEMEFKEKFVDFGAVKKGEKREHAYEFTNKGTTDIVISLVSAWVCPTVQYPEKPIKPGEKGIVHVVFDSAEKDQAEVIDVDIFLDYTDPVTEMPAIVRLQYKLIW